MSRDLFGHAPAQASPSSAAKRRPAPVEPIDRWRPAAAKTYFSDAGVSLSVDELYALTDFRTHERQLPDQDLVVVLDTSQIPAITYLIQIPKNHPSRLDPLGRQDPARQPFWKHGEVIHIRSERRWPD